MKKPANFLTFIIIVITLFLKSSYAFADSMPSVNDLLDSLDNALNQRTSIMAKQQTVINNLRRGLDEAGTPDLKTSKYEQLYSEYLHINGDTAIYYALQATNAAEKTANPETILKARFCLLRAYTRQGAMGKANEVVNSIGDIESVAPSLRPTYADLLLDFYTRVSGKTYSGEGVDLDATEAWNKYSKYLDKNSFEYCYHEALIKGRCDVAQMEKYLIRVC